MDKNFMNIDDLVRQRLGGGEEHEQAGSWGRMRDLLDKEMPQKKPAGMYFRRSLSALALLLLVTGAGIGGYEMLKNKNTAPGVTAGAPIAAATAITENTATNNTNHSETNNNNNKTTATNENKTINNIAATTDAKDMSGDIKPTHADMPVKEHKQHISSTNSKPIAANNINHTAGDIAGNNNEKNITNNTASTNTATTPTKHTQAGIAGSNDKSIAGSNVTAKIKTSEPKTAMHEKALHKAKDAAKMPVAVADKKDADNSGIISAGTGKATTGKETIKDMPLASSLPATGNAKKATQPTAKVTAKHRTADKHTTPAIAANTATVDEVELTSTDNNTATAHKSSKHISANKVAAVTKQTKPAAKTTAPVAPAVLSATAGNTHGNNSNTTTGIVKSTRKAQKMVQHLVLAEHLVRVSPTRVEYRLDTISMENATEDADFALAPPAFGPLTLEKYMSATEETSEAVAVKENHVKKAKGSSTLENLNAAFNDMKTKVKGAHFTPGLTAGINGTFFGPNSFKGFQFGVTGNMSFSETFAVQSELKYFHRINNNYTLNDNYYTYTPSAGGYTKTMIVNPYNVSTLHSIELPISVRYCISNFNFYVGGNFEYSFAINTGAAPLEDPSTSTQVATVGNDNTPKIKAEDFNSRFGVGYLFGASVRVSPNVLLDFRSVQNLWDNSSSAGAKIVSGQLYRSPSLQLSLGVKLGSNKRKE